MAPPRLPLTASLCLPLLGIKLEFNYSTVAILGQITTASSMSLPLPPSLPLSLSLFVRACLCVFARASD